MYIITNISIKQVYQVFFTMSKRGRKKGCKLDLLSIATGQGGRLKNDVKHPQALDGGKGGDYEDDDDDSSYSSSSASYDSSLSFQVLN